jgi:hypothetical protein
MPGTITGGVMGGRLMDRQAKPLNGQEVARAIESHLLSVANKILNDKDVYSDRAMELIEILKDDLHEVFLRETRLSKIHILYPKVGWEVKVRLEHNDHDEYHMSAEIELDLQRGTRIPFRVGQIGFGTIIGSREEERIPTTIPDKRRKEFDLPITAEIAKPNGEVVTVDLRDLQNERRSARTVDVGSAKILGQEVTQGEKIVLPSEVPEISMDELVAEPPTLPKNPDQKPLPPPGTMANKTQPKARFK